MTLTLIGVNHRTAPVELRERLSIGAIVRFPRMMQVTGRWDPTFNLHNVGCVDPDFIIVAEQVEEAEPK